MKILITFLLTFGLAATAATKDYDLLALTNDTKLSAKDRAEKLTQTAYEFFGIEGAHPSEIAQAALKLDPSNEGARFIVHFIAPVEHMRGLVKRAAAEKWKSTDRFKEGLSKLKTQGEISAMLIENTKASPITTSEELAKFIREWEPHLMKSILELRKLRTIRYQAPTTTERSDSDEEECRVERLSALRYRAIDCEKVQYVKTTIDRLDVETVIYLQMALLIYTRSYSAYKMPGTLEAIKADAAGVTLRHNQLWSFLKSFPEFGQIKDPQMLNGLMPLAGELINGLSFIRTNIGKLCDFSGDGPRADRVFANAICVAVYDSGIAPGLGIMELLEVLENNLRFKKPHQITLGSRSEESFFFGTRSGTQFTVKMDLTSPLRNPIADLKTILPLRYSLCGAPTQFPDPTFGGVFPDRDLENYVLQRFGKSDCDLDRASEPTTPVSDTLRDNK